MTEEGDLIWPDFDEETGEVIDGNSIHREVISSITSIPIMGKTLYITDGDVLVPAAMYFRDDFHDVVSKIEKSIAMKYRYISVYQRSEKEAFDNLSKEGYRLLCYFRSIMGRGNTCFESISNISKACKISNSSTTKAINELVESKYLIIDGTDKRRKYTVSPAFGFKGNKSERHFSASRFSFSYKKTKD